MAHNDDDHEAERLFELRMLLLHLSSPDVRTRVCMHIFMGVNSAPEYRPRVHGGGAIPYMYLLETQFLKDVGSELDIKLANPAP